MKGILFPSTYYIAYHFTLTSYDVSTQTGAKSPRTRHPFSEVRNGLDSVLLRKERLGMEERAAQQPNLPECFIPFTEELPPAERPARFTFPFQYQPHPWALYAAQALQQKLDSATWQHNFDVEKAVGDYGKMFGVLVVEHASGQLGYLAAFSGKVAGQNHHPGFVPPVFDVLEETGFFRKEEKQLNLLNERIWVLEHKLLGTSLEQTLKDAQLNAQTAIQALQKKHKEAKALRDAKRSEAPLTPQVEQQLQHESARDHFEMKDLKRTWKAHIETLEAQLRVQKEPIEQLKQERRQRSAELQQQLFEQFRFLNYRGEESSLATIFSEQGGIQPPAGAGECAAPKLLQYAYLHQLQPLCLAEFWWGQSPVGEIRLHRHYYPACRGKCAPILGHMLQGLECDPNPQQQSLLPTDALEIVFENNDLLVINKPAGLLSVPGKETADSVQLRIRGQFPEALLVHRLDQHTSGLLLIGKNLDSYRVLQRQFLEHRIQKRYIARLEGIPAALAGTIDLPLRVDLDDRPRQMVCPTHGKAARTHWKLFKAEEQTALVHFFPVTGRTHQLRVHAAHPQGLGIPILGDSLYGTAADRLHLHAGYLLFYDPATGAEIRVESKAPFEP